MLAKHGAAATSCNDCHAYGDAAYTLTYLTGAHGNGSITLNDNPPTNNFTNWQRGTAGDAQKSLCVKCHTDWASATYYFSKTWTNSQELAGHTVTTSCGECHSGGVSATTESQSHAGHGLLHTTRRSASTATRRRTTRCSARPTATTT
jgi:hypothetical protein